MKRIAARLDAIEDERPALEADIADLERGIPRIEPDMVRCMLWRVRQCDGPAAWIGAEKSTWKPPDGAFSGHSRGFGAGFPTRIRENAARTL